MTIKTVTRDTLDAEMGLDGHVIRSYGDGETIEILSDVYAPEVVAELFHYEVFGDEPNTSAREPEVDSGWTLLTGFTGQDHYSGAAMHSSEFIGGGLARYILTTPGIYAACVISYLSENEDEVDPDTWAIAYRESL